MRNKVVKNAMWLIGVKIIQAILSFIIGSITARYLGPSNYGVIGYAQSIVTFVVPVMQLGLAAVIVQEIVCHPEDEGKILGTAHALSFVSAIFCMIGVVSFTLIANAGETETIIVCALYSISLLCQSLELIQFWFQAKLYAKYSSVMMFGAYVIVSIYKIFLLVTQKSVYWFTMSYALDYIIIAVGLHLIYYKLGGRKYSFSKHYARELLSKGKYYIISGLMVTIFAQTDRIMLNLMIGEEATGYYAAAVTCTTVAGFVFAAIIDSVRPTVVENKKKSKEQYEKSVVQMYSAVIYFALAFSIGVFVFAPLIVRIVYGEAYSPTVNVLKVLVWYTTFSYLGSAKDVWILVENKQKYLLVLNAAGAIANVILNFLFIPHWHATGAAIASLITQFFTNVIMVVIVKDLRPNAVLYLKALNPTGILRIVRAFFQKNK